MLIPIITRLASFLCISIGRHKSLGRTAYKECPRNALLGAHGLGHLHGGAQDQSLLGADGLGHILNKQSCPRICAFLLIYIKNLPGG